MLTRKRLWGGIAGIVGTALVAISAAGTVKAADKKPSFFLQANVVTFDLILPNPAQVPVGLLGSAVGTATGAINGAAVMNLKITFTSDPSLLPITCSFDERVGITDVDGDQIIFRSTGTGAFQASLVDPTVGGNPGVSPFQVFGFTQGRFSGRYEVVATSGKYANDYPFGKMFSMRAVWSTPATPPNPIGNSSGSVYVEVIDDIR